MTRARDLARVINPTNFTVDSSNSRVGLGSTTPTAKLNVTGIISATAFYGDGSNLEGVASAGLGTAVEEDSTDGGAQIYFTDTVLAISGDVTVNPPDSSNIAYTQYQEISVDSGADFIIGDGDDFIPDILGISSDVQTPGLLSGGGGRVRADNYTDKAGTGAPTFNAGLNVVGLVSATSFSGDGTGLTGVASTDNIITGTAATFTGGINAAQSDVSVRNLTGVAATFTGVLTYEDVTNIDSIGIVTARAGVQVGSGQSFGANGPTAVYYGDGSNLTGIAVGISTTKYSPTANAIIQIGLGTAQHHELTLTAGFTTITTSGGTYGDSHSLVLIQPSSGICTVGFSTYFLFPSGSTPSMSEGSSKVDLVSFVVKDVTGNPGTGITELLASAGLNYQ